MFAQPKYIQAGISIIFPRKSDIRRSAGDLENALTGEFNPPTVIGVPDEMQSEVPRMVFESPNGYSQLVISQVSMTINVGFSPDYQIDDTSRQDYLGRKIPLLFKSLNICGINNAYFVGLNWIVRIATPMVPDNHVIQALARHLLPGQTPRSLFDLEVKRVEVIESKYFSNVTFANYRQWSDDVQTSGIVRRPQLTAADRGVQIVFDFNDRYSFNEKEDYRTDVQVALDILTKAQEISSETIQAIIRSIE